MVGVEEFEILFLQASCVSLFLKYDATCGASAKIVGWRPVVKYVRLCDTDLCNETHDERLLLEETIHRPYFVGYRLGSKHEQDFLGCVVKGASLAFH